MNYKWISRRLAICILFENFLFSSCIENRRQKIIEEPNSTKTIAGSKVILKCKIQNKVGQVSWSKGGFIISADRKSLDGYPRMNIVGLDENDEYNLEITNVELSDQDDYQCKISAGEGQEVQRSKIAILTVLVPPKPPRFINLANFPSDGILKGREGHPMTFGCAVEGGKPQPSINWSIFYDQNGMNVDRRLETTANPKVKVQNGLTDLESLLTFEPRSDDDGKFLTCSVQHPALNETKTISIKLEIKNKPNIRLILRSKENSLIEGGKVKLYCQNHALNVSNSNGSSTNTVGVVDNGGAALFSNVVESSEILNNNVEWYADDHRLLSQSNDVRFDRGPILTLINLNRSLHHNRTFSCKVQNDVGQSIASYRLMIKYPPKFLSVSQKQVCSVGETVSFTCLVDSNPSPTRYKWTKIGATQLFNNKVDLHSPNLTLNNVKSFYDGKYVCEVSIPGYQPVYQSHRLYIRGPPKVEIENYPDASSGGSAKIYCKISGYPSVFDKNVTWYKGRSVISGNLAQRFEITFSNLNQDEMYSVLIIKKVLKTDFDVFNCTAINDLGLGFATVKLIETELPIYLTLVAIATSCMAILVLVIFISIWFNRRHLCGSNKTSTTTTTTTTTTTHSGGGDDQSDLTIKMEDMGQHKGQLALTYYSPTDIMYGSTTGPLESYELVNGKQTYVALADDTADFDELLLPPFHHHFMPTRNNGHGPMVMESNSVMSHPIINHSHSKIMQNFTPPPVHSQSRFMNQNGEPQSMGQVVVSSLPGSPGNGILYNGRAPTVISTYVPPPAPSTSYSISSRISPLLSNSTYALSRNADDLLIQNHAAQRPTTSSNFDDHYSNSEHGSINLKNDSRKSSPTTVYAHQNDGRRCYSKPYVLDKNSNCLSNAVSVDRSLQYASYSSASRQHIPTVIDSAYNSSNTMVLSPRDCVMTTRDSCMTTAPIPQMISGGNASMPNGYVNFGSTSTINGGASTCVNVNGSAASLPGVVVDQVPHFSVRPAILHYANFGQSPNHPTMTTLSSTTLNAQSNAQDYAYVPTCKYYPNSNYCHPLTSSNGYGTPAGVPVINYSTVNCSNGIRNFGNGLVPSLGCLATVPEVTTPPQESNNCATNFLNGYCNYDGATTAMSGGSSASTVTTLIRRCDSQLSTHV